MKLAHLKCKEVHYKLNPLSGYFEKQPQLVQFLKLPFDLKIEETQDETIKRNGANLILTGRIKKGSRTFFTGMIPTRFQGFYFGNDYENTTRGKSNSLVVIGLSDDFGEMTVYYFNGFYIPNRQERMNQVCEFISTKKGRITPPMHI